MQHVKKHVRCVRITLWQIPFPIMTLIKEQPADSLQSQRAKYGLDLGSLSFSV